MAASHGSGPVFSGGAQLGLGLMSPNQRSPIPGGLIFYVGNYGAATSLKQTFANGDGLTPDTACLSLYGAGGALDHLQGRKHCGDIIYILPGHVESVTAADFGNAGLAVAGAAGYSVVGLGSGTFRGLFNLTAAASTILLNQPCIEYANLQLNFAVTAATVVVTPMTVSQPGCRIVDCFINWGASTTIGCGSTLGAISVTSTYFEFLNNTCLNLDVAGTAGNAICLLSLNGANYCNISWNRIYGSTTATTVGPIHFLTTLSSDVYILHNYIENLITSSTIAISSAITGVTGDVEENRLRVNSGIQPITVSANMSTTLFQNFATNTVNKAGALVVGAGVSA